MIIHVKQAFEIRNQFGDTYRARNNDIATPPDWVASHPFFKALCDSGKITVHIDSRALEQQQIKEEIVVKEEKEKKSKR